MHIKTISNNQSDKITSNIEGLERGKYIVKGYTVGESVVVRSFVKN